MAITENAIEKYLIKRSREHGCLCFKFSSPSTPGVCDRILISRVGTVFFIELKKETGRLSKLQEKFIKDLSARNVEVFVFRSKKDVDIFIEALESEVCR